MLAFFIVLILALIMAALESLDFTDNGLTDFELNRRRDAGDDVAIFEQKWRAAVPSLVVIKRFAILFFGCLVFFTFASNFIIILATLYALIVFVGIEILAKIPIVGAFADGLVEPYQSWLIPMAEKLSPALKLLPKKQQKSSGRFFYSREELLKNLSEDDLVLSEPEKLLVERAFAHQSLKIKDIMLAKSGMATIDQEETVSALLIDRLHKTGKKHFLVIDKSLKNPVGVLGLSDLLPLRADIKKISDAKLASINYVNQDLSLDHLMQAFLRTGQHLFIVVNESEEIVGAITIEDLLESLVGRKIIDEFDQYEDRRAVARLAAISEGSVSSKP